jgi:hypothetical protein
LREGDYSPRTNRFYGIRVKREMQRSQQGSEQALIPVNSIAIVLMEDMFRCA